MSEEILVLSTGGTIASTAGKNGATPTESGEALLKEVPEVRDQIEVEHLAQRPSPDMDFEVLERLRNRITNHGTGVIVTHGTDTMAESAYYLDLVRDWDVPVVFTGAQRRPDQPGSDGPANLVASVSVIEELSVRSAGDVYTCLNSEVQAARDAVKVHTWRPDTFGFPGKGPVDTIALGGIK